MKNLSKLKKINLESYFLLYIFILSVVIGCAYQQKTNERKERISHQFSFNKLKSPKDYEQVIIAFKDCNTDYFSKLTKEDFNLIEKEKLLSSHWDIFYNYLDLTSPKGKNCFSVLGVLGANGIRTDNIYVLHILLKTPDFNLIEKVINSGGISNIVLNGVEEQFSKILKRMGSDTNTFYYARFVLERESMKKMLSLISTYKEKNKQKSNLDNSLNEDFILGESYPLCGAVDRVTLKPKSEDVVSETRILPACSDVKTAGFELIKIVNIKDGWIELELGKDQGQLLGSGSWDYENPGRKSDLVDTYYVQQYAVSTPYVVSDGRYVIALKEVSASKITYRNNIISVENNNISCDDADLSPEVVIHESNAKSIDMNQVSNELVDGYRLPIDFNVHTMHVRKSFVGSFQGGEFACGT